MSKPKVQPTGNADLDALINAPQKKISIRVTIYELNLLISGLAGRSDTSYGKYELMKAQGNPSFAAFYHVEMEAYDQLRHRLEAKNRG